MKEGNEASLHSLLIDGAPQRSISQGRAIIGGFPSLWQARPSALRNGSSAVARA
jgi:hypothetical protein